MGLFERGVAGHDAQAEDPEVDVLEGHVEAVAEELGGEVVGAEDREGFPGGSERVPAPGEREEQRGGLVLGAVAALILGRVLNVFLFGVEPTDPVTVIGAGLLFAAVAVLACWIPTRRAASVNPLEALRSE